MRKCKNRWLECFLNLDIVLGVTCLMVLVLVTFFGAIMRYFFGKPFVWQEEVQVWMIIWTIFSGASYAFRCGAHVSIEVLVETFPKKAQVFIEWFGFFCTVAVLLFVFINSVKLNMQFYDMGKFTSILKIPSYKIYWVVSLSCLWMIVSYAYQIIGKYFGKSSKEAEEGGEDQ